MQNKIYYDFLHSLGDSPEAVVACCIDNLKFYIHALKLKSVVLLINPNC